MNVNKWRNWALVFMFGGFFVMYLGLFDKAILPVLLILGGLSVVTGILMYFRFGPVNTSIHETECPRCGSKIRLTGETDACSQCRLPLRRTADGQYEPYVPN
jgi:hypothetical protein